MPGGHLCCEKDRLAIFFNRPPYNLLRAVGLGCFYETNPSAIPV
jgi:hypothetical protein